MGVRRPLRITRRTSRHIFVYLAGFAVVGVTMRVLGAPEWARTVVSFVFGALMGLYLAFAYSITRDAAPTDAMSGPREPGPAPLPDPAPPTDPAPPPSPSRVYELAMKTLRVAVTPPPRLSPGPTQPSSDEARRTSPVPG